MDVIELLRNRRSIRQYLDRAIEPETVQLLTEAILRAPSSRNIDPWEFVFVDDRDLLARLAVCKPHGASFLEHAPLGIVVCGDGDASDVWVEDCSIASILVQMAAQSLGLGSCWVQVRNRQYNDRIASEQYVQDVLGIPMPIRVESIIAVGYPAEEKPPRTRESLKSSKVHSNTFGN